ncbi:proline--tRNA ligase, cytoplasmic-like protein isoform X1, partial [Tanacetum coccineum]
SHEFLWQEGHSAFATKEEADVEVLEILELYRRIYEEYLAVPVVKGKKSELEKFAGGLYTTSVEAFIPNTGRGVQGATSHGLGQNFAKMFEINFEDEKGEKAMVWQNSWAYSTRTIGVMVMVHGDDKGLVVPPKVSEVQVIVIPVPFKDADVKEIMNACSETVKTLDGLGIRVEADLRENYSPGWKYSHWELRGVPLRIEIGPKDLANNQYSHWELRGVPLRIEIGPKDLANNQVRAVCRDNGSKVDLPMADLGEKVKVMLDDIQQRMFENAKQKRDACIQVTKTWDELIEALGQKKLILAPWCDEEEVEKDVKAKTKGEVGAAKTLCSPFDQPEMPEGGEGGGDLYFILSILIDHRLGIYLVCACSVLLFLFCRLLCCVFFVIEVPHLVTRVVGDPFLQVVSELRFTGFSGHLGSVKKGVLVFDFWKEQIAILFGLPANRQHNFWCFRFVNIKEQQQKVIDRVLGSSIVRVCDKV